MLLNADISIDIAEKCCFFVSFSKKIRRLNFMLKLMCDNPGKNTFI